MFSLFLEKAVQGFCLFMVFTIIVCSKLLLFCFFVWSKSAIGCVFLIRLWGANLVSVKDDFYGDSYSELCIVFCLELLDHKAVVI